MNDSTLAQPTDVPLPIGADPENVDKFETDEGVTSRLIWSIPDPHIHIDVRTSTSCDLRIVASQLLDGSIVGEDNDTDCPLVYVDGVDYTLTQARDLVVALRNAVSLAERWIRGNVCEHCEGRRNVFVTNGKWQYTVPCPTCLPDEFRAAEVDGDDRLIGPSPASSTDLAGKWVAK